MSEKVSVTFDGGRGQWVVCGAHGEVVMALPNRDSAIGFATETLARNGGGELCIVDSPGAAGSVLSIAPDRDHLSQKAADNVGRAQAQQHAQERQEAAEKRGRRSPPRPTKHSGEASQPTLSPRSRA